MSEQMTVDRLLFVMVSGDQIDDLTRQLNQNRFYFTLIEGSGGFLQKANASLVIGMAKERTQELVELLQTCCQRKRVFVSARMETSLRQQNPLMIEAEIGGAVMFAFEVERFEQF